MATGTYSLPIPGDFDATVPPGLEFQNNIPVLLFDDTVDEICYWRFRVPVDYASAPVLKVLYSMASATTLEVIIGAELWSNADGEDAGAESYDTVNTSAATTVPGTAGLQDSISLTLTNNDSMAAGEKLTIRFRRDADNAGDDATGDMELLAASLEYTTT